MQKGESDDVGSMPKRQCLVSSGHAAYQSAVDLGPLPNKTANQAIEGRVFLICLA